MNMKKFLISVFLAVASVTCFAQTQQWFQATSFAAKPSYSPTWSDWESSTVKICFDFVNQTITIYSPQIQIYKVIRQVPAPRDNSGYQEKYQVMGQNGYYYFVRLRIENNGNSQLYVDANDGSIVYNVVRI